MDFANALLQLASRIPKQLPHLSTIAILTNGIDYHFFSDIVAPNKTDDKSFFEFSMSA